MAARWTVLFRLRAVEVAVRCVRTRGFLAGAAVRLVLPMRGRGAGAQAVRARHELVRDMLAGASDDLALAASSMKAAESLVLCGASADPMLPLLSIQHIPDGNRPHRLALSLFQSASAHAEAACLHAERCCVYLRTVNDVLAVRGHPGIRGVLGGERSMARACVKAAMDCARMSAALAIVAHWLVS